MYFFIYLLFFISFTIIMSDFSPLFENILSLALSVWMLVCFAKIFMKAGEWWWKAIIPIYNLYIFCKIVRKKWFIWILMSLPIISILWLLISLFFWFANLPDGSSGSYTLSIFNYLLWFAALLAVIATLVVWIIIQVRLCKAFWKSGWFSVWMIFLGFIFAWIIAFDKSEYDPKLLED